MRHQSKEAVRAATIVLAGVLVLALLWTVRGFVLLTFFAILLAMPVSASATFLQRRWRVRRSLGVAATILVIAAACYGGGLLLAKPVAAQMQEVSDQLPRAVDQVEAWLNGQPFIGRLVLGGREVAAADRERESAQGAEAQASEAGSRESLRMRMATQLREHAGTLFPFVLSTVTAVSSVLLLLFLIIYFAVDPDLYVNGMLRLVPEERRERTLAVANEVGATLKQWLRAQGISMAVIGAITTGALYALDVKAALALGLLAGLSEFIPVFGPILSAIPALGIAFVDSPTKALYVLIAYVIIQQIESNIVTPLVMKKGVDVPPVVTIVAGTVMAILFGFLGLLVAVPLAAALLTVGRELTTPARAEVTG